MKQTIKKLVLVVMCFTLICCEEKESNDNSFNFQQKTKTENPFNYLGERHNQILDDFAESLGNSVHFSTKDVYNFSVNEGHLSSNNISYLDYKRSLDSIDDITFDYFFGTSPNAITIINDSIVANYLDDFRRITLNAIRSSVAVLPNVYADSIEVLEEGFMHNYGNLLNIEDSLRYETVLGMLAIAKYSYQYWYDASFNKSSLWYPIIQNRLNVKSDKPSFWDRCKDVVNAVAAGIACAAVDVYTFATEACGLSATIYEDPSNGKDIGVGVGPSIGIGTGACDKAGEASINTFYDVLE